MNVESIIVQGGCFIIKLIKDVGSEWWIAIFTLLLFIFTALLWLTTHNLSKDAKKNIDIVQKTANRQIRAYVSVMSDDFESASVQDIVNGLTSGYALSIVNTGKAPAKEISYWVKTGVFKSPLQKELSFHTKGLSFNKSLMDIVPNQKYKLVAEVDTSSTYFQNFTEDNNNTNGGGDGKYRIYVWGEIKYSDVFREEQDHKHYTKFCYSVYGAQLQGGGRIAIVDYCDKYIGSD